MLTALEKGEAKLKEFIEQQLEVSELGFHEKLPKLKLKTFSTMVKETSVCVDKTKVVVKADRDLFSRMIVVAQSCVLNLREVLSYELGPLLWSLATVDGCLVKTQKSKLLQLLEKTFPQVTKDVDLP